MLQKTESVLKVFKFDDEKVLEINKKFEKFSNNYISLLEKKIKDSDSLKILLGNVNDVEMDFLLTKVDPYIVIPASSNIMEKLLLKGIVKFPPDIQLSSEDSIKVWSWNNGRKEYRVEKVSDLITLSNVDKVIEDNLMYKNFPEKEKYAIHLLVRNFITENVFYDHIQTTLFLNEIKKKVKPVTIKVMKGDKIIRKGFPVTEQQLQIARALDTRLDGSGITQASGSFLYLILLYSSGILMFKPIFSNSKDIISLYICL